MKARNCAIIIITLLTALCPSCSGFRNRASGSPGLSSASTGSGDSQTVYADTSTQSPGAQTSSYNVAIGRSSTATIRSSGISSAAVASASASSADSKSSEKADLYGWIGRTDNYTAFTGQSTNGRANATKGLAISEDWTVWLDGVEYPVLATPISKDGPQSFVSIPYHAGAKISVQALNRTIASYTVSPLSMQIPSQRNGNTITLMPASEAHICIQANNSKKAPLIISCFSEIPRPAGNVKVYEKGLHKVSVMDLVSNQTIYLETGAVLEALPPSANEKPTTSVDWAGVKNYRSFIGGWAGKNIAIIGNGVIDTSALDWHARAPLSLSLCNSVTIKGVTFIGAGSWTVILDRCANVTIDNVRIFGFRENSDGIDIVNSQNVTVQNCCIRTGDDAICVKAMQDPPTLGGKNILVEKCMVWNDKVRCLSIAGETKTDISGVTFRDCDIVHSTATWSNALGSLCIIVGDNGIVSDVLYDNIRIEQESEAIFNCMILKDQFSTTAEAGNIRNITFRNITADSVGKLQFLGYDDTHRVSGVTIDNLVFNGERVLSRNQIAAYFITNSFADAICLK